MGFGQKRSDSIVHPPFPWHPASCRERPCHSAWPRVAARKRADCSWWSSTTSAHLGNAVPLFLGELSLWLHPLSCIQGLQVEHVTQAGPIRVFPSSPNKDYPGMVRWVPSESTLVVRQGSCLSILSLSKKVVREVASWAFMRPLDLSMCKANQPHQLPRHMIQFTPSFAFS